jgi:hypothetical protein
MARALLVGDVLALKVWTSVSEQAAVNTYNMEVIAVSGGSVTDQNVADAFSPVAATFYGTYMGNGARYDGVQVYTITPMVIPFAPANSTVASGGATGGADLLPRNTAAIMKYRAIFRGPKYRGRVFLPFAASTNTTPLGVPIAAFNTLINGWGTVLGTPIIYTNGGSTATLAWVLAHRTTPLTVTRISVWESAGKFGQVHRRGDYGRPNLSPV